MRWSDSLHLVVAGDHQVASSGAICLTTNEGVASGAGDQKSLFVDVEGVAEEHCPGAGRVWLAG